ncbi:FAD-dependent monooxygenase [Streptomyces sp. NPDC046215]|uniref:squalene monooxygenase n=1 Tax=Streptomyces stramineus TaxID=173861 RepID=A0ABN0ZBU5_9ACTN
MRQPDVIVVGAGPGGCACALAFARRGARVVLLEATRTPPRRLAGEWIQPAGVQALQRLGVDPLRLGAATPGSGFLVHPGDGSPPITLPFPDSTAVTLPHDELAAQLRRAAARTLGIDLVTGERVLGVRPCGTVRTTRGSRQAPLVVGADGRSSVVRRAVVRAPAARTPLSRMAGFLLPDIPLPREEYGHIMLGGPGPALAYRLGPRTVRLFLDVPLACPTSGELASYLRHGYTWALPPALRPALAGELRAGRVQWAANHFCRRVVYGRGRCALIGDAVGFSHPLTASGLTAAFLDAEHLARSADVETYARGRRAACRVPDRIGAGMHRMLTDHTPGTRALRQAMFTTWRANPRHRDRTLRLLAMTDVRSSAFHAALMSVLGQALASSARHAVLSGQWAGLGRELAQFAAWLEWINGPKAGVPPQQGGGRLPTSFLGL